MTKKKKTKPKIKTASLLFLYHLLTGKECDSIDCGLFSLSLKSAIEKSKSSGRPQVVTKRKNHQRILVVFPKGDICFYHLQGDVLRLCGSDQE